MFPISEVLDILAMIRGQKPWNWPDLMDDSAGLLKFAAAQIRSGNTVQQATASNMDFEGMLQSLADAHAANALSLPFDWKALLREAAIFLFKKFAGF